MFAKSSVRWNEGLQENDSLNLGVILSGPHGPELYSEISNCRPHGLVIFHSREDYNEL